MAHVRTMGGKEAFNTTRCGLRIFRTSRVVEQNVSFPFPNTGAEQRLYLEHISASCKDSESISKMRRKIQAKSELQW